jgi:hypothetical protein
MLCRTVKKRLSHLLLLASFLLAACGCGSSGSGSLGTPPSANAFNGQYAFVLSGFDSTGNSMGVAGSVTADGLGHITGGSVDVNDNQVISSSTGPLTGTYTLDSNFRGTITLTNGVGSVTQPLAFAFTLRANGASGNMIGADANNFVLSGTMQKQDSTAFSLAKLTGDFAFEFGSRAPSQGSLLGRFTLGQNGSSTNVILDVSVSGFGPSGPLSGGPVSGTFASPGPNGSGRGTFVLIDNLNRTGNFIYYVVAAETFLVIEDDPTGSAQTVYTGIASKQILPFSGSSVNTAASVFALSGVDAARANDISAVGLLQITGTNTANLLWDTNDVGSIFSQVTRTGQSVTFDPSTGRGTITVTGGFANGLFNTAVFYLTNSGNGFLLDTTTGANNRALAGRLQLQSGSGSVGPATISGNVIRRMTGLSIHDNGALDGFISTTVSNNILTGFSISDFRGLGRSSLNQSGNVAAETVAIDANTGRGTLTFTLPGTTFVNTNVFYIVGQNQYVLVDETPPPYNDLPIEFVDPQ